MEITTEMIKELRAATNAGILDCRKALTEADGDFNKAAGLLILPELTLPVVILLAAGALLGDLVKSFFKWRLNKERGAEWILADQYDFVLGAFAMLLLFQYAWVVTTITPLILLWIVLITPLLHRVVNIIGYLTGVKDVPW